MMDELHLLLKLQVFDSAIDETNGKIKSLENSIHSKTKDLNNLKSNLTAAKSTLQTRQAKKKELELAADEKEKLVKKHQGELNSLKSNDAYKAMLVEINTAKQEVHKIEDDILIVMEAIDVAEKDLRSQEQKVKSEENVLKGEIQKLEEEKSTLLQTAKTQMDERQAYASSVPAKLVDLYTSIRETKGTLAIVPMIGFNCSGCRMVLTPHLANEVRKRKKIVRCDTCQRIVYLPEESTPPQQTGDPASISTSAADSAATPASSPSVNTAS